MSLRFAHSRLPRSHWLDPLARRGCCSPSPGASSTPISARQPSEAALPSNWFLDVNRGSQAMARLPGCTDDMADLLVRLQRGGVQFAAADDLFRLLDLPTDLAQPPHLIFHWYGDAPLQPVDSCISTTPVPQNSQPWPGRNNASMGYCASDASAGSVISPTCKRLSLPASSVEALIGRVSFGQRRAGPSLPPRG